MAACQQVLQQRGLKHQLGPNSTAIEGDWGPVMEAVKACHEVVHELGAPRIFTSLKINSRTDRDQALEEDGSGRSCWPKQPRDLNGATMPGPRAAGRRLKTHRQELRCRRGSDRVAGAAGGLNSRHRRPGIFKGTEGVGAQHLGPLVAVVAGAVAPEKMWPKLLNRASSSSSGNTVVVSATWRRTCSG